MYIRVLRESCLVVALYNFVLSVEVERSTLLHYIVADINLCFWLLQGFTEAIRNKFKDWFHGGDRKAKLTNGQEVASGVLGGKKTDPHT